MQKVLFIDRDGTIVIEPPDNCQLDSFEKLEFYPGVFQYLSRIAKELDYLLVMVTNQDGLGTSSFPEEHFHPVHNMIIKAFENEGVVFSEILIDRSFPHEKSPFRKPGTAMLKHYMSGSYDLENSFVIGDRDTDMILAENLGCKSIFLNTKTNDRATFSTGSWKAIYEYLAKMPRTAQVLRTTKETRVAVEINLDGTGKSSINTGLGFFDHMLEQIARHGSIDLDIDVQGDLHIDEHHTIEDTGIALGKAFTKALGSKKGIERYGFLLPMDDSLAQVALDFGGRAWLIWQVEFRREMIGSIPTEMFKHFFKSFSDNSRCNLNIKADGENEHHKIEAIFKAFAKALKMAIAKTNDHTIPSTKGTL